MLMLVSMTLTLMQGRSGLAKVKNQRSVISASKKAISIKTCYNDTGRCVCDLDFENVYMA